MYAPIETFFSRVICLINNKKHTCERTHGVESDKMDTLVANVCIALFSGANSLSAVTVSALVICATLMKH